MSSAAEAPTSHSRHSPFRSLFKSNKKVVNQTPLSTDNLKLNLMPDESEKKKRTNKKPPKGLSLTRRQNLDDDCKNLPEGVEEDPASLVEALQAIGDDQPKVARSIPKNFKVKPHADRSLKDCLYPQEVYDDLLARCLQDCDLVASHMDECVVELRTRSPEIGRRSRQTESQLSTDDADSGRGASSPASPPRGRRVETLLLGHH